MEGGCLEKKLEENIKLALSCGKDGRKDALVSRVMGKQTVYVALLVAGGCLFAPRAKSASIGFIHYP